MTAIDSADVVVIGSGPSGATAAHELVRLGRTVTLLDAGAGVPRGVLLKVRGNTVFRWVATPMETDRHVAIGDPQTAWYSSRSLGGLSNYWTSAVPRMHPDDFTEGASLDEIYRWPVTYDDLEPYYGIVERLMRVTADGDLPGVPPNERTFERQPPAAWRAFAERTRLQGHRVGLLPMAYGAPTSFVARSTGWNSYHCVIAPLEAGPRFRLVRNAEVVRLDWSSSAGAVRAVEYVDRTTGEQRSLPCRAVVLAAGTLDSTRVLLQSRSDDFPDGLGNASGVVGRFLHDHPRQWWPAELGGPMALLSHPMYIARRPVGEDAPLMASSLTLGMVGATTRVRAWCGGTSNRLGVQVFGTMVPTEDHRVELTRAPTLAEEMRTPLRIAIGYDEQALRNIDDARQRFVDVPTPAAPDGAARAATT